MTAPTDIDTHLYRLDIAQRELRYHREVLEAAEEGFESARDLYLSDKPHFRDCGS